MTKGAHDDKLKKRLSTLHSPLSTLHSPLSIIRRNFSVILIIIFSLVFFACGDSDGSGGTTTYNVIFNTNGGSYVAGQNVAEGGKAARPTDPTKTAYECIFVGWFKEPGLTTEWDFAVNTVTANTTLYAKWEAYQLGDTGPGGGKIFYLDHDGFTLYMNAADTTGITAYYLEAAPVDMPTLLAWASGGAFDSTNIVGTVLTIGTGRKNTAIILATDADAPAAKACDEYSSNGKTDWFLPSRDELEKLYVNRLSVGNMVTNAYWSSSQRSNPVDAYYVSFSGVGGWAIQAKNNAIKVRAIRAF